MTKKQDNHNKFINRCERLTILITENAPKILIENEVRRLNEYFEAYQQISYGKTNADVYSKDSDDEHYEYVDHCISNGHIDIEDWRKLSI